MPRKNRQKLHKELRGRAEARAAQRVQRRRDARTREREDQLAITATPTCRRWRRVVAARRAEASLADPAPRAVFIRYLENCAVTGPAFGRALSIFDAYLAAEKEADSQRFGLIVLLARGPSTGSLRAWRPPQTEVWASLVQHLLGPWPVPAFLMRVLDRTDFPMHRTPWELRWVVEAARVIARGKHLASIAGSRLLPTPLTRRMCHLFVTSPDKQRPIAALRVAQVVAMGGTVKLGEHLAAGLLGHLQGDDPLTGEAWWARVIAWLVAHPEAVDDGLDDRLLALKALRARSSAAPFELTGRTVASVGRLVEAERARQQAERGKGFRASGYRARSVVVGGSRWSFVELRSSLDLHDEGEALAHCASTYLALCASGRTSIWSARREGVRALTIEVVPGAGRIAQVRGFANRAASSDGLRAVTLWAEENGLVMPS